MSVAGSEGGPVPVAFVALTKTLYVPTVPIGNVANVALGPARTLPVVGPVQATV